MEEQLSEKEAERMSLSYNLTTKDGEILKLNDQLHNQGQKNAILKKSLDEKNQTAIDMEKQVGKLFERLQLKETEVQLMCTHLYLNILYKLLAKHFSNNENSILYDFCRGYA